jgi:hypothetical protein
LRSISTLKCCRTALAKLFPARLIRPFAP